MSNAASDPPHFIGSSLALLCLVGFLATLNPLWLFAALVWNRPATFRQPLFSLRGNWKMYWQTLTGRIPF